MREYRWCFAGALAGVSDALLRREGSERLCDGDGVVGAVGRTSACPFDARGEDPPVAGRVED